MARCASRPARRRRGLRSTRAAPLAVWAHRRIRNRRARSVGGCGAAGRLEGNAGRQRRLLGLDGPASQGGASQAARRTRPAARLFFSVAAAVARGRARSADLPTCVPRRLSGPRRAPRWLAPACSTSSKPLPVADDMRSTRLVPPDALSARSSTSARPSRLSSHCSPRPRRLACSSGELWPARRRRCARPERFDRGCVQSTAARARCSARRFEAVPQAVARRALDQPGQVGDHQGVEITDARDRDVGRQRRERVVGDLGRGRGDLGEEGRLARVGQADHADLGEELELQAQLARLTRVAERRDARRLAHGRGEVHVAESSVAALGDLQALAQGRQVAQQVAVQRVEHLRAERHFHQVVARCPLMRRYWLRRWRGSACAPSSSNELTLGHDQHHAAAPAAVAVGPALGWNFRGGTTSLSPPLPARTESVISSRNKVLVRAPRWRGALLRGRQHVDAPVGIEDHRAVDQREEREVAAADVGPAWNLRRTGAQIEPARTCSPP